MPKFNHNGVDIDLPAKGGAKLTFQGKSWQLSIPQTAENDQKRRQYAEEQAVVLRQLLDASDHAAREKARVDEETRQAVEKAEKDARKARLDAGRAVTKANEQLGRFG